MARKRNYIEAVLVGYGKNKRWPLDSITPTQN